jgi:hypothetical protein
MSVPKKPNKCFLFLAVLFSKNFKEENVIKEIKDFYKIPILNTKVVDFVWSDYYEKEMGHDLKRVFIVFKKAFDRNKIVWAKKKANKLEKKFMKNNRREINIDPGLLCLENVILSTNKSFFHRIYLDEGIFAEITLFYKNSTYQGFERWTYPEYRSSIVINFFNKTRKKLEKLI